MSETLDPVTRHHVHNAAEALKEEFAGIFSVETIERYIAESVDALGNSRITVFVPVLAHRFARERLMAEFGERRRVRFLRSGLVWAMAAMTLLFAAGALKQMRRAGHAPAPRALQAELEFGAPEDQELLAENGFVPVPYAAPLAPGEFVEVVQRDLTPAALARMGFLIQTASANEVTTEVAVGEDGLPRAVRVPESFGVRFE